jgi:hypothetical protein
MRYILLKQILFFVFLIVVPDYGICQSATLTTKIIDQKTKQPITGVIVLNLSNPKYATYTDEDGIFSLMVAKNDSLKISCIGYKESIVTNSVNLTSINIELTPDFILLNEVVVNCSLKENISDKEESFRQGGSKGSILLVFIPNVDSSKSKIITKLNYHLGEIYRENEKINKGVVRVRLYSSTDTAIFPKSDLLHQGIIETLALRNNQTLIVDIRKLKISFPANGVFIGLEWLGEKNNSKQINLNPAFIAKKTKVDPFNFISFYGKPFVHIGKRLNAYYTTMFKIEVEEY